MAARTEVMDSSSESEFSGFETVSVSTDEYNVSTDEYYNVSTDPDSDVEGGATARPARQRRRQPVAGGAIPTATWNDTIAARNIAPFVLNAGPKLPRNFDVSDASPLSYFTLMMEDGMFGVMADETNAYAALCQREKGTDDRLWTPTDATEIKAYLGISMLMGINPMHEYSDYWSVDPYLENIAIKRVMTLNRYEKLCQYLHCNCAAARLQRADANYHPMAKVAPLVDMARRNFKSCYQHGCAISVDEAMKGFRGRTELRMYMPNKPDKFGIKFWARCDGKSSYMSDFALYSGKRDTTDIQREHGLGYRVVHEMSRDLVGLNHCLYFDRFFTSVKLVEHLKDDGIYACATMMTNRKGTPLALKVPKGTLRRNLPNRGDSMAFQKDAVTVTAWNDNNVVVIAHTHLPSPGDLVTCERQIGREKRIIPQPKAIESYNFHMNGVDIHDQMRKKYPAGRPSKKYWKYIMWFVIDCCRVNAWICYRQVSTRQVGRRARFAQKDFILELSKQLIGDFSSRKRITMRESPSASEIHKRKIQHTWQRLPGNKRRCKGCYQQRRRLETVYGCAVCNSHMCDGCFRRLHEHHGDEADA